MHGYYASVVVNPAQTEKHSSGPSYSTLCMIMAVNEREEGGVGGGECAADQPRPSPPTAPRVLRWRAQPARAQMDQSTFAVQLVALFGDLV